MEPRPVVHRHVPPTEDQVREMAEADTQRRAAMAKEKARLAPLRRRLLEAGADLADIDAAMDCLCGCHPSVSETHDGGTTCPCQLDEEERRVRQRAVLDMFASWQDEGGDQSRVVGERRLTERAEKLGVEVRSHGGGAPYVLCGLVDGRGFYLRERHDLWQVVIAPDGDPGVDPWGLDRTVAVIEVASGDSSQLETEGRFDPARALGVAVDAVRLFLLRRECPHDAARRFCPTCGVEISRAGEWRIATERVSD